MTAQQPDDSACPKGEQGPAGEAGKADSAIEWQVVPPINPLAEEKYAIPADVRVAMQLVTAEWMPPEHPAALEKVIGAALAVLSNYLGGKEGE